MKKSGSYRGWGLGLHTYLGCFVMDERCEEGCYGGALQRGMCSACVGQKYMKHR